MMLIENLGFYRDDKGQKVEVVAVRDRFAIGFTNLGVPCIWWADTGAARLGGQRAIQAEWREPMSRNVIVHLVPNGRGGAYCVFGYIGVATPANRIATKIVTLTEGEGMP